MATKTLKEQLRQEEETREAGKAFGVVLLLVGGITGLFFLARAIRQEPPLTEIQPEEV